MTNDELDQEYLALRLSGKLQGNFVEFDQYDPVNNDWDYYGATEWRSRERIEDFAEACSVPVVVDFIDMPYEIWLQENI